MRCWFCENIAMHNSLVCQRCSEELDRQLNKKYRNMRRLLDILNKPLTAKDVAKRLGVAKNTAYRYLVELEGRGFVKRKRELRAVWTDVWYRVVKEEGYV